MLVTYVSQKRVFVKSVFSYQKTKNKNRNKTLHIQGKNVKRLKYKSINVNYKNFYNSSPCLILEADLHDQSHLHISENQTSFFFSFNNLYIKISLQRLLPLQLAYKLSETSFVFGFGFVLFVCSYIIYFK